MKRRVSLTITEAEAEFYLAFAAQKGIRGGIAGLLSIATHAYVLRNRCKGLVPPWEAATGRKTDKTVKGTQTGD